MAGAVDLDFAGFRSEVVDKVMRLLVLLDRVWEHPVLGRKVCLHGGTALNLFVLGAPRLSVDIDLNYIGSADRETTATERPTMEQAVIDVARALGYRVAPSAPQHAGRSFKLGYQTPRGSDQVKIDLDYLNRSPLLPVTVETLRTNTGASITFPLQSAIELFAGKTKALLERVAVRDLYDVGSIAAVYPELLATGDDRLLRRVMLYYLSMAGPFPRPFEVARRFAGRENDVTQALHPVLLGRDRPGLDTMIDVADAFVRTVSTAGDDAEAEYLARATRADFAPELLFAGYPNTLAAARADPAAAWKMRNLAKAL
jgi:predicted nucleotidyltransferase component of viral defense system